MLKIVTVGCRPWGPPQGGGARGPWPIQILPGGGAVMHLAPPPDFRKNSVMYTINVQCFSLKKNNGMHT